MIALTPGQITKVDSQGRLSIPLDLLKAISWWSGETIRVVGELTRKGLLRVHPSSAIASALRLAHIEGTDTEAGYISLAVTADRYRELSLYAEGRLRMTKEVCPWLGFNLGEKIELYAQPFPHGLEVMTMEHRFGRLADAEEEIVPWTFKATS